MLGVEDDAQISIVLDSHSPSDVVCSRHSLVIWIEVFLVQVGRQRRKITVSWAIASFESREPLRSRDDSSWGKASKVDGLKLVFVQGFGLSVLNPAIGWCLRYEILGS